MILNLLILRAAVTAGTAGTAAIGYSLGTDSCPDVCDAARGSAEHTNRTAVVNRTYGRFFLNAEAVNPLEPK